MSSQTRTPSGDKIVVLSLLEVFALYPDAEAARLYLEAKRWPSGVVCPACAATGERVTPLPGGYYSCLDCRAKAAPQFKFTVRTRTVFERSHVPLNKWLYAMYFLVTARKGISSLQLSKEIGITQKSAWFLLQRLREACGDDLEQSPSVSTLATSAAPLWIGSTRSLSAPSANASPTRT